MKPYPALAAALLLVSCARPVAFDPSFSSLLGQATAEAALPKGYAPGPGGLVVSLDWSSSLDGPSHGAGSSPGEPGESEERAFRMATSLRRPLFPEAGLHESTRDGEELPAAAFTSERRPREGRRFLPYRGRYPDESGYGAYELAVVAVRPDSRAARRLAEALAATLDGPGDSGPRCDIAWVAAVGDLLLSRGIGTALREEGGAEAVFGQVLPAMRAADLCLVNLEGCVSDRGRPAAKSYTFRFDPATLPVLAAAGIDYVSVANNHSFDYGRDAFVDTLDHLAASGIATSGAGLDRASALVPASFEFGRGGAGHGEAGLAEASRFDVYALAAYPRERSGFDGRGASLAGEGRPGLLWDDEATLAAIAGSMRPERVNVVMAHGGEEWSRTPTEAQRRLYRRLVEGGADLVIGSHPHVLQGYERYKDGLIFYSLGNFVFPGMGGMAGARESVLARVGFLDGYPAYVEPLPLRLSESGVDLDPEPAQALERLRRLSMALP